MKIVLPTGERVYQAVKAELLAGDYSPGERIEAVLLAERYMTSITPVRAALHRLVGERLVDAQAGEGFHAPLVTEAGLRDLYAWNGQIIQLAWQAAPHPAHPSDGAAPFTDAASPPFQDVPAATASLFAALGERSGNEPCAAAILQLNDRLHVSRRLEVELIVDLQAELATMANTIAAGQSLEVRHTLTNYHRRRIRLAADLVRLMRRRLR